MDTKIVTIEIPENIHRDMKVSAATNGQTIKDWLTEAIQEKCKEQRQSQS